MTVEPPTEPQHLSSKMNCMATAAVQNFDPLKPVCQHQNAIHCYANDPKRQLEANHYCSHLSEDLRQCLIYDSNRTDARLIAVEYIISRAMFDGLPEGEQKYWHSHAYEVLSGQLIMPRVPAMMEDMEMRKLVDTYGKTWCLWQTDRGDKLPLGEPQLLTSFIRDGQVNQSLLAMRDEKFGVNTANLRAHRLKHIETPTVSPHADQWPEIQAFGKVETTTSHSQTSQAQSTAEPAQVGTFTEAGSQPLDTAGGTVPRTETQAYTQLLESDPRSVGSQPIAPTATGRP